MPQVLDIPNTLPFTELTTKVIDYLRPFRAMWPVYWLKAVAIRAPPGGDMAAELSRAGWPVD